MPKRERTHPWKHIYGVDRGYTRRKDVAEENLARRAARSDDLQLELIESRRGESRKESNKLYKRLAERALGRKK